MKYKVGDKVRYDSGQWWLYATVSAVFEHSISPCYRLNVERMEKKNCKFSITQFEFDLEPYHDLEMIDISKDTHKWENAEIKLLGKYYEVLGIEEVSKMLKRSRQAIEDKFLQIKQEPVQIQESLPAPDKKTRKKGNGKQKTDTVQTLESKPEKVEPVQKSKIKRGEAWELNLERYRNGEKSKALNSWITLNRKEYKTGKLTEQKLDKLIEIDFPFETTTKKNDRWHRRLEEWKKGERKSRIIQQWRQRSIKKYLEGRLENDKITKLKEIGILS